MELEEKMFALMDRYLESGLSQRAFCAQEGITLAKFGYWRRRWMGDEKKWLICAPTDVRGALSDQV